MFLVDSAQAAADWDGTLAVINNILQRADAEVVSMRKWQERKLAYDINRTTRGTYILCYFKVDGRRISGIEKDVQLSEQVMRVLVLTTEKRPADMLERDISGEPEEKPAEESAKTETGAKPAEEKSGTSETDAKPAEEAPKKPEEAPAEPPAEAPAEPTDAPAENAEPAGEAAASESDKAEEVEKKDESAE